MNDSINPFDIDASTASQLSAGMEFGGAAELPFIAVLFWALNGSPQQKAQLAMPGGAPALYFGGWMCERSDMDEALQAGAQSLPAGMVSTEYVNRDGKDLPCYSTRRLILAPIGVRSSWVLGGARSPSYMDGSRQHAQVLALLANTKGNGKEAVYEAWGPVVLTAKGYQAQAMLDGLKAWNRHTQALRSQIAPNVPAWAFYLGLGTFGEEYKARKVGKAGRQSTITPVEAYLPEHVTEELLRKLFVGRETAKFMADLSREAREWLHDWDEPTASPVIDGAVYEEAPDGFGGEIPF